MYGVQGIYTDDTQYCLCGLQSIFETGHFDPQRTTEGACTLHTDFPSLFLPFIFCQPTSMVQCSAACACPRARSQGKASVCFAARANPGGALALVSLGLARR
jgi:hypothetical protein